MTKTMTAHALTKAVLLAALGIGLVVPGCQVAQPGAPEAMLMMTEPTVDGAPRELHKGILPPYVIEPPDILAIDAVSVVPKSPYRLRSRDVLWINVQGTLPDAPISGLYPIGPGGVVSLGFSYGSLKVSGKTVDEAQAALKDYLLQSLTAPQVSLSLAEPAAKQQIAGEHLVGPDGTVTLGTYGSVPVVGLTIADAKKAIEEHLAQYLEDPEVAVDVFAYNSKVYYVVTQGAGLGDAVVRFPVTGNETVLDAISQINGLGHVSSKRIWIARPGRSGQGAYQLMPVDWNAITQCADFASNYQVLPGDRIYVAEDKLVALDTGLGKLTAPLERILGFSVFGVGTVTRFSGPVLRGGGNQQATF